jgi:uncharacterized membrane protein
MSILVAIAYHDPYRAEEVRTMLRKMHRDDLADIDDAVVVVKDEKGRIRLDQPHRLTGAGVVNGGFWEALIGVLIMAPRLGTDVAAPGAISAALADVGISEAFMEVLAAALKPGRSVLFALLRTATPDGVLNELKATGGTILRRSLSHENEAELHKAIGAVEAV